MHTTHYTKLQLDNAIEAARQRKWGKYGMVDKWLHEALDKYTPEGVAETLLIGTCEQGFGPWYEGILLERNYNNHISVVDYNEPVYEEDDHAIMVYIYPPTNTLANLTHFPFDLIVSISSIEHSGLGRYGPNDIISENGDLNVMQQIREIINETGRFILSVPLGLDKNHSPWHRIYGRERLPKLLKGWRIKDSFGYDENLLDRDTGFGWDESNKELPEYAPILVLEKE